MFSFAVSVMLTLKFCYGLQILWNMGIVLSSGFSKAGMYPAICPFGVQARAVWANVGVTLL